MTQVKLFTFLLFFKKAKQTQIILGAVTCWPLGFFFPPYSWKLGKNRLHKPYFKEYIPCLRPCHLECTQSCPKNIFLLFVTIICIPPLIDNLNLIYLFTYFINVISMPDVGLELMTPTEIKSRLLYRRSQPDAPLNLVYFTFNCLNYISG